MATKAKMIHILRLVKYKCKPEITITGSGRIIRNTCIMHKYLEITKEAGYFTNTWGCLGGNICNELQRRLGLKHSGLCPTVHRNVYNLVKDNGRAIRI